MAYYFGWEALVEVAFQEDQTTAADSGDYMGLAHLRSLSFTVNENTEYSTDIASGHGRNPNLAAKGVHEVTGTIELWMEDQMGATMLDTWLLKWPFDYYNVAHDAAKWKIPEGTYASNELLSTTIEVGHNKTGDIRVHQLVGCMVNSFTFSAAKGEKCIFTYNFMALSASSDNSSYTNGSATRGTADPLGWHNVRIYYDAAGAMGTNIRTDFTAIDFTLDNGLIANYDLTVHTPERSARNFIPGQQIITGTFTTNKTDTANLAWYDWLYSDASAPYTPAETVAKRDIEVDLLNTAAPTTANILFKMYNCIVGNIPMDIDPEKVQELSIPYACSYMSLTITSTDSTPVENWDHQVA